MKTIHRYRTWLLILAALLVATALSVPAHAERGLNLAVIAHSVSTSMEAREVLRRQGWSETSNLRQADGVLVVCRSMLSYPLNSSYDSIKELDEDADFQLNISGANFHVYVYRINDDLSVDEVKHIHYPADE
ncbi:MAG: hypothetical protein IE931_15255 [Sphingobacteriales bacterium]|nr:hypothetical protein [Sphingobacteriales bacterium]